MMMMDPSYYFEYKSADSERREDADSTGSITGQYGYKTAGGNDILVKYSASADTGFVIENKEDLAAALEKSAAEAALVKAKPYTGETVEVEYTGPNTEDSQEFVVKYTSGVGGFVVDNLEELLAKANPQTAEYEAIVAEHAAAATAAARKSSGNANSPAAEV